ITVAPFCRTGPGSWARFNPAARVPDNALEFEGTKARPGPISVAVAVTVDLEQARNADQQPHTTKTTARMVVYGDSDWASNARLSLLGNKDLFLNTVQWLAGEERLITQRPKNEETAPRLSTVFLTARQNRTLFWLSVVVEPAVILLVGVAVAVYRRRKT
ncbi:MAG: hypothetical protein NZ578_09035, partial [Candidatus Binatia bacterium]|nr:hypothetical protein [Candidatus Binatia bacterium]